MNNHCAWCEKKRDTVCIFIEQTEEYESICRRCAIKYYEEQIWMLKLEQNIVKMDELKIDTGERSSPVSPVKLSPRAITGTHCF